MKLTRNTLICVWLLLMGAFGATSAAHAAAPTRSSASDPPEFYKAERAFKHHNYATAFPLYQDLAKTGVGPYEYTLATMYDDGLGTPKNPALARKWMVASAGQKFPYAIYWLMVRYGDNSGLIVFNPKDPVVSDFLDMAVQCNTAYQVSGGSGFTVSVLDLLQLLASDRAGSGVEARYAIQSTKTPDGRMVLVWADYYAQGHNYADNYKKMLFPDTMVYAYSAVGGNYRPAGTYWYKKGHFYQIANPPQQGPIETLQQSWVAACNQKSMFYVPVSRGQD